MALIAACAMEPGQIFRDQHGRGRRRRVTAKVTALGFPVTTTEMQALADSVGEKTMVGRTGGAPTFAVGMAHMFAGSLAARPRSDSGITSRSCSRRCSSSRHRCRHPRRSFPRAGSPRAAFEPLRDTRRRGRHAGDRALRRRVGLFLYQGVVDPLGGINSLWPIFGIANQLLAVLALCPRHYRADQDGPRPLHVGDAAAARLVALGDEFRRR